MQPGTVHSQDGQNGTKRPSFAFSPTPASPRSTAAVQPEHESMSVQSELNMSQHPADWSQMRLPSPAPRALSSEAVEWPSWQQQQQQQQQHLSDLRAASGTPREKAGRLVTGLRSLLPGPQRAPASALGPAGGQWEEVTPQYTRKPEWAEADAWGGADPHGQPSPYAIAAQGWEGRAAAGMHTPPLDLRSLAVSEAWAGPQQVSHWPNARSMPLPPSGSFGAVGGSLVHGILGGWATAGGVPMAPAGAGAWSEGQGPWAPASVRGAISPPPSVRREPAYRPNIMNTPNGAGAGAPPGSPYPSATQVSEFAVSLIMSPRSI
jgi:hypothetical protein